MSAVKNVHKFVADIFYMFNFWLSVPLRPHRPTTDYCQGPSAWEVVYQAI